MLMALASAGELPTVLIPGGVTLLPENGEDAAKVQTIGARFAQGQITLEYAAEVGCHACATPGGGCQFLGTAATSQVVAEALGLALPHTALAPSGQPVWLDAAKAIGGGFAAPARTSRRDEGHPDPGRLRKCDGGLRGVWRFDQSTAASACHRARGRANAAQRCGLDARESRSLPPGGRAAQWSEEFRNSPGISGWRCAGGDVASAYRGPVGYKGRDCCGGDPRRMSRLVATKRTPARAQTEPARARWGRSQNKSSFRPIARARPG